MADEALLGGVEGQGFKQLMKTFESCADPDRCAGHRRRADRRWSWACSYAEDRKAVRQAAGRTSRGSHGKLALMAVEIMIARQLTYHAAREKKTRTGAAIWRRGWPSCWAPGSPGPAADNALQIHGGNGFALEYQISRILCDARILNIFEGAAEIQAQVIARRLLG